MQYKEKHSESIESERATKKQIDCGPVRRKRKRRW